MLLRSCKTSPQPESGFFFFFLCVHVATQGVIPNCLPKYLTGYPASYMSPLVFLPPDAFPRKQPEVQGARHGTLVVTSDLTHRKRAV